MAARVERLVRHVAYSFRSLFLLLGNSVGGPVMPVFPGELLGGLAGLVGLTHFFGASIFGIGLIVSGNGLRKPMSTMVSSLNNARMGISNSI